MLTSALELPRSSFYHKSDVQNKRDLETYQIVKEYHIKAKGKSGIRQLKMQIERSEGLILNHKRIARIKRKFKLETMIRRKNKYRFFAKKKHEHETCKNVLQRNFSQSKPDQVYSMDITEVRYNKKKAYIAAIKDLCSKEVIAKSVSNRINIELTNSAVDKAIKKLPESKRKSLMIHTDQGFHFTHISYRERLQKEGITQSMSRKGNCLDNAPIESFFGTLKDHLDFTDCKNIKDVEKEVTKQINYYNHRRPQLGLKKMPPSEYRRHLNF